jgi:DNA-binding NarL/FixJ family response regulator
MERPARRLWLEVIPMASKIRLRICHHNRLFRECLASALSADESREVHTAGEPVTGAPEAPGHEDRVIMLIDAGLPDTAAFRHIESIRGGSRGIRIILMVPSSAPELVKSCLRADVDGCVGDDDTLDDLRRAIDIVLSGQSYCSPQVAHRLFTRADGIAPSLDGVGTGRVRELTKREDEILRMIAHRKLSNKQIARELRISIYTVKNHVHSIIEKLGAEDRQAAARHAVRRGLLSGSIG